MRSEPEPGGLILHGSSFQIQFRRDGDRLRAYVTGETGGYAKAIEYWRLIARETVRAGVSMLLVVDYGTGDGLTSSELEQFVRNLGGLGLEAVRTGYVGVNPARTTQNEATEILAREQGFVARVFSIEAEASLWLRHGAT